MAHGSVYVFGYASLTRPESLAAELGRPVGRAELTPAELAGRRRAWNVGSDASSHPERTIRNPDGTVFDGVVAVLGLVDASPDDRTHGIVFAASAEDLAKLDVRERNYRRIDATADVTFPGKPEDCRVFAYVPSAAALDRLERALHGPCQRPVAVRKSYLDHTRIGFAALGKDDLARFDAEPAPSFPVVDLAYEFAASDPR
jgi:hypothetical protein